MKIPIQKYFLLVGLVLAMVFSIASTLQQNAGNTTSTSIQASASSTTEVSLPALFLHQNPKNNSGLDLVAVEVIEVVENEVHGAKRFLEASTFFTAKVVFAWFSQRLSLGSSLQRANFVPSHFSTLGALFVAFCDFRI